MKQALKKTLVFLAAGLLFPCTLLVWLEKRTDLGEGIFIFFGQGCSLIPGKLGSYVRVAYYMTTLHHCPYNVHIAFGSFFSHRAASLGRNISIGAYCIIGCAAIDDNTVIASRVSIPSGKRQHCTDDGGIARKATLTQVNIGKNSWIGEGAIIMDDVGDDCTVAAGSVVISSVEPGAVVGGNPAKTIKQGK